MASPRVLVVDDEDSIAGATIAALSHLGCVCTRARSSTECLTIAPTMRPDLVVLDVMMPGFGSGIDALRAMRSHPGLASLPVVLFTSMAASSLPSLEGVQKVWYVRKGSTVLQFIDVVRRALGLPDAPMPAAGTVRAKGGGSAPPRPRLSGRGILVVDDDPHVIEILTARLEAVGYRVHSASDAAQAFIQATAMRPDLVVLDIQMPSFGTGIDALVRMRAHPALKRTPILLFSGMPESEVAAMIPAGESLTWQMRKPPSEWSAFIDLVQRIIALRVNA